MLGLKNICYRGGIIQFKIPATWKEEYRPEGGATFYEESPDSGTFRLNVLSLKSKGKETGAGMISRLIAEDGYLPLQETLATKQFVESTEEQGENLRIYFWEVAVPVEPCSARYCIFSYTILRRKKTRKRFEQKSNYSTGRFGLPSIRVNKASRETMSMSSR